MRLATTVAMVMFGGVTLYALFAGADFGGGFWDLFAGDAERGADARDLIEHSVAPVWEANHVWLIFVLVVMWTAFPRAFAPIMSTLAVPLTLAAVGIILRGSAFAFRKASGPVETQRWFGAVFAFSSVLTPFFLGAVVGGVASGRVPASGTGSLVRSWVNPTSMLGGALAVVVCAFLAAVYLTADADAHGLPALTDYFARRRATAAGVVAGAVAIVGIVVLHADAHRLFGHLTGRALPLLLLSGVGGLGTLALVRRRRFAIARLSAALAVVAVVWGWAAGQYPYLVVGRLTIDQAQGARATLEALLGCTIVGLLVVGPALAALLLLTRRGLLRERTST